MAAIAAGWPCALLRRLAACLTWVAEELERPGARRLALESAPIDLSAEERIAELRIRLHVPLH